MRDVVNGDRLNTNLVSYPRESLLPLVGAVLIFHRGARAGPARAILKLCTAIPTPATRRT
jgi:hypothetical protein